MVRGTPRLKHPGTDSFGEQKLTETSLNQVMTEIDRFLDGPGILFKDLDLRPFLLQDLYIRKLTRPSALKIGLQEARSLTRMLLLHSGLALSKRPPVARERNRFLTGSRINALFVFGFPWADKRHTGILEAVVRLCRGSNNLVVTDKRSVFDAWTREEVPCILLSTSPWCLRDEVNQPGLSPRDRLILSQAAELCNEVEKLLDEFQPRVVLTTQDFHFFDQAFARMANLKGIETLTHQHGMIPRAESSLYKFVFSRRIAVWGKSSARLMSQFLDQERLWLLGTDRFNHLVPRDPQAPRPFITVALSPVDDELNWSMLSRVVEGLAQVWNPHFSGYCLMVKLHPSMNRDAWADRIGKWITSHHPTIPCFVYGKGGPELLWKTRFLLASRSTISLDAVIAGASVLELQVDAGTGAAPELFDKLPESLVTPSSAANELVRRLLNPVVDADLRAREDAAMKEEVEAMNSSELEARWLCGLQEG